MTLDHLRIGVVSLWASLDDGPPVPEDTVKVGDERIEGGISS